MHTRLFTAAVTLSTLGSFLLVPMAEAGRRPTTGNMDTTKYSVSGTTRADFLNTRIWLPGTWTVTSASGGVVFSRQLPKPETVTVRSVLTSTCGYQVIRQRILKAWGTPTISQDQARIEYLKVGTSKYSGYKWEIPTLTGREKHWCLPQDGKYSAEMIAPVENKDIVKFIEGNMLLQLAVRRSRH